MRNQTIEQKIKVIKQAIYDGVAVFVERYNSKKSNTCRDRKVYPVKIKGDNLLCADIEAGGAWRTLKLEWISGNVYVM